MSVQGATVSFREFIKSCFHQRIRTVRNLEVHLTRLIGWGCFGDFLRPFIVTARR